jgi:hypothetical protein
MTPVAYNVPQRISVCRTKPKGYRTPAPALTISAHRNGTLTFEQIAFSAFTIRRA